MKRKLQAGSGAGLKGPCTEGTGPGAYGSVGQAGLWGRCLVGFPPFSGQLEGVFQGGGGNVFGGVLFRFFLRIPGGLHN